ncbi:MAG: NAD(P)-dependent oxidoreductase [Caldilineaceae bacterium]
MRHTLLFLTERSPRHQRSALKHAPDSLAVTFLSHHAREEISQQLADCDFLISERAGPIDAQLLAKAPKLRLIQRLGSLTYDIDLLAAQQAGIPVCATPVVGCIMVAEHMLLQILALVKKVREVSAVAAAAGNWRTSRRTDENVFAYNWSQRHEVRNLYQSNVGILGFGEIGVELARMLKPMRLRQLFYHKRQRLPASVEQEFNLTYAPPEQIYQQSDILCSLLPYSQETDQSLNRAVFAQMKRGALLVHCGSGSVIDEPALAAAIRNGQLGGAALDTYEYEPILFDNPLVALARTSSYNVLLTPHTAAGTDAYDATPWGDFENVVHLLNGEPLTDRVV